MKNVVLDESNISFDLINLGLFLSKSVVVAITQPYLL